MRPLTLLLVLFQQGSLVLATQTDPCRTSSDAVGLVESPETGMLSLDGLKNKQACEAKRDDQIAAHMRDVGAHQKKESEMEAQHSLSKLSAQQKQEAARTTRELEIKRASTKARVDTQDIKLEESSRIRAAQDQFSVTRDDQLDKKATTQAKAVTQKEQADELALSIWRSHKQAARENAEHAFNQAEQQFEARMSAAAAQKQALVEEAFKTRDAGIEQHEVLLQAFENGTKALSSQLSGMPASNREEAVQQYNARYNQQHVLPHRLGQPY